MSDKPLSKLLPFLANFILILREATVTQVVCHIELSEIPWVSDPLRPVVLMLKVVLDNVAFLDVTLR